MTKTRFLQLFVAAAATISLNTLADDAETLKAGEFTFKYGKPWERMEVRSSMRAGQLKYNHEDESLQDPELVFYYFGPGQGGGIEANIDRWIGQFDGTPKTERETKEFDGKKVHFLYAKGTYMESSGGPFSGNKTARDGYMLLGAILESDQGAVFLKLYGEEKSVEALKDAFMKLSASPFED